ncbi:MAG TPA: HAD family hydrolase [Allosphingosinicella sp.]|jgi:membrane protein
MTEPRRPRAILFDVDGTLVDTNRLHAAAWRETFLAFGIDIPLPDIAWQIGKGGDNLLPTLAPSLGESERKAMEEHRSALFRRDYLARAVPFPGVRDLFERIYADGIRIVLASSSEAKEVAYHLSLIACADLVYASTSKDDVEHSKPCPDIFAAALEKAGAAAAEAVVVGDSPWDVKAAAKLGVATVGFRSGGFPDEALLAEGAAALYDGPRDLLARYGTSPLAAAYAEA